MRALLIQPPIRDFYRTAFREYPLGLLSLAGALEAAGHEAVLLDARGGGRARPASLPAPLAPLERYYTRANNLFLGFKHFGITFDEIGRRAAAIHPDVVCISAMFTPYVGEVLETARAVRRGLPGCRIIAGGHHATADPESLLEDGAIDTVIRGEGEELLPVVLQDTALPAVVADGSAPARIDDLDRLPLPARHLVDPDRYRYQKRRYTMILTSRGCPHRCSFCSVHTLSGHAHRVRSIDGILAEIDECAGKRGIRAFDFQDDNLLFDADRMKSLLEHLITAYGGRDFDWQASNGLNAAHLDRELITLMKRLGFQKLDLALGTGGVASREQLCRPETVVRYEEVLGWAQEAEMDVTTYIILGLPFQPIAEMHETVAYLKGQETLIAPSVFYNVPGMPCFEEARRFEIVDDHIARRSSAFNNNGIDFTRHDIFQLFRDIRTYNLSLRKKA